MAYETKTWTDRVSEYPTRRTLTDESGETSIVTVARNEGTISAEGDAFSAANMNDLEERIASEFDSVNDDLAKKQSISTLINVIYPIGSIYMSVNNVSPASFLGGTWEQIKDKFLLAAGSSYSAGSTGGEATHKLTTSEMPSHTHTFTGTAVTSGSNSASHTHTFSGTTSTSTPDGYTYYVCGGNYGAAAGSSAYPAQLVVSSLATEKTKEIGSAPHSHAHSFSGTTSSQSANHTHSVTAKGSNSSTGGSTAHNNMPPYLTVYMWKRTA